MQIPALFLFNIVRLRVFGGLVSDMPTLNWLGKDAVINHHNDVKFKVLDKKYDFNTDSTSENKIIHGDNLEALKALLPEYEGKIKCIYIDPPYNTGNEGWVYNDNVNSERIKKWLGQVVGKESEDFSRHDKWLCMMYPRLKLLHKLLSNDGAIFISIDDNEQANLKLLCDEIFGQNNFVGQFSWIRKKKGSFLSKSLRKMIEYVLCYSKNAEPIELYGEDAYADKWQPIVKRTNSEKELFIPKNIITTTLVDGEYEYGFKGKEGTGMLFMNSFIVENKTVTTDLHVKGHFVWSQDFFNNEISNGTKISLSNKFGFNVLRFNQEGKSKTPSTLINESNGVGTNEDASWELQKIFNSGLNEIFQYSKPHSLIQYIVKMLTVSSPDAIILDSFAGSGTTAQAVLNLNKQDGGNRKFILVEMEDYAETITAERVKRVINGYGDTPGTGGDFSYYELGQELFVSENELNEDIDEETIRKYVWYSETHTPYQRTDADSKYFMGDYNDTDYYFYYEKDLQTSLSLETLDIFVRKAPSYIVYADVCNLPLDFMRSHNITFRKIPRNIRKF